MIFSSLPFLFLFLPIVLALYYVVPERGKNLVLLAASILFYAWGEPVYVVLMLLSALWNYVLGLDIGRSQGQGKKVRLVLALAVDLLLLGFFKYYGFCVETVNQLLGLSLPVRTLALPIGISFYTFQTISYLVDVYRGTVQAQRSFLKFAVYITMFPQLIAGPIVKYADIAAELEHRQVSLACLWNGMPRFLKGLAKKVLLANNLGLVYTTIQGLGERSVLTAWVGIAAYTLQIYFDFSGYSDMAVGLGRMLGFTFDENFRHPYVSRSVTEFWRRWHISLSSWFRDYVYIPLGGNRVTVGKHVRNLLIVWGLTGLWHGASWNFVLWGLYYGVLQLMEKYLLGKRLQKLPAAVQHVVTMVLVMMGWVLFSNTELAAALTYLGELFGFGAVGLVDTAGLYYLGSNLLLLGMGGLCASEIPGRMAHRLSQEKPVPMALASGGAVLLCVAYLVYSSYNPFLYFRF
jgi:alginate O-acetyltransferase complex protein AlgI